MKLFIFEHVEQVSNRYHPDGGIVVIARSRESAQALIEATNNVWVSDAEWATVREFDGLEAAEEEIVVFPDAGCC